MISFSHAPRYRWREVDYRPELSADPGPRARRASARGQGCPAGCLGLGIAFPVLSTVVVQFVPMANVGETTGMNALVRMLGGAVGTQIVAVLITSNSLYGLPTLDGFTDAFVALGAFLLIADFAARAVAVQSAARTTN